MAWPWRDTDTGGKQRLDAGVAWASIDVRLGMGLARAPSYARATSTIGSTIDVGSMATTGRKHVHIQKRIRVACIWHCLGEASPAIAAMASQLKATLGQRLLGHSWQTSRP